MRTSDSVAVIDLGSNTIKLLVARRDAAGRLEIVHQAVEEERISRGLGAAQSRLGAEGMERGLAAVARLLAVAQSYHPRQTALVATSAVRDAANGGEFRDRLRGATGLDLRLLSGDEEARSIGRGLAADPVLADARDFYVFDLGGGSLECLALRDRRVAQAVSLPLGCVRLTERCVANPAGPFTPEDRARVVAAVRAEFDRGAFHFDLAPPVCAVGTGGTVTTARIMLGDRDLRSAAETSPAVARTDLETLLAGTAILPLAARCSFPGLPPARADVFPTALATVLALADLARLERFVHSFYNLRFGIAAELLGI